MTGKAKSQTTWGGARKDAGRKPKYMMTEYQVQAMLRKARQIAREKGITLDEVLIRIGYGEGGASIRDRIAAMKTFKDFTMARSFEVQGQPVGMPVGLPAMKPDPAKL